ncbi:type 1 glutamine amidotransferase [Methylobacter tundripaludum]|uniref:type 1 glutamine amidotransferase n=1 Tax=Methylobacter tundripaludum TaxID=173365 RepID=UPI0004DEF8E4|nr:type 1 glutamine amidotransferase [Methylobacter tundripaludum]
MKPLRVFQHDACGDMGYLATYLDQRSIPYEMVYISRGESVPPGIQDVSGLIFLGSTYSVNADYAWIDDELALIRRAVQASVPVMGLCFGGQLISKALGGAISQAPGMQVGWYRIEVTPEAAVLTGAMLPSSFEVFEWHEDTFSIPPGGIPLFYGDCIKNQGFVHGQCLALQFHLEMTLGKIRDCLTHDTDGLNNSSACVQNTEEILEGIIDRLHQLHTVADTLFGWWLSTVKKSAIGG